MSFLLPIQLFKILADETKNVIFGGRLGMYRYYDMHNIIEEALKCAEYEKERHAK